MRGTITSPLHFSQLRSQEQRSPEREPSCLQEVQLEALEEGIISPEMRAVSAEEPRCERRIARRRARRRAR